MMELKGLASISIPNAQTIQIEPWDKGVVKDIEKAIQASSLGLNPNTAGTVIRLILPSMTEENRKSLVKVIHQKAEQTRIGVRNIRESVREKIAQAEKEKEMGEDEKFRLQEQLDKLASDYNGKIETMAAEKEKEIMTI
jgi:ribosome recycling factor